MGTKDKKFGTTADFLKRIGMIFYAILLGQILFMVIAYFVLLPSITPNNRSLTALLIIALLLSIGGYILGKLIFNRKVNSRARAGLREKLRNYYGAFIVRIGFLQGASLFAIIAVIITGNIYFFVFTILLILVQLSLKPSIDKISNDLMLDIKDKSKLGNRNQVL